MKLSQKINTVIMIVIGFALALMGINLQHDTVIFLGVIIVCAVFFTFFTPYVLAKFEKNTL